MNLIGSGVGIGNNANELIKLHGKDAPMATGLSAKLTGQIGEHLVVAELGRRAIIATPFSGNVPDIDVLRLREQKIHLHSGKDHQPRLLAIRY